MSEAELRAAVAGHRWLQSLRLRPDLVTPGLKPEAQLQAEEAALLDTLNLKGAHVLEVGAGNGAFSFAALRRGAARVLATDHLAWTLPGSDALSATQWAAHALGASLEMSPLDPRELTPRFGNFHVVMATACFEQLFNPIQALRGMRAVTERVLLIETLQDGLADTRPLMMGHGQTLPIGGPEGAWVFGWAPNRPLMTHLLTDLGFNRVLYRDHPTLGTARGLYAAFLPEAPDGLLEGFHTPWINLTHPQAA
ncbi:class I SAM-dependent methyltransferase [Sediminicoccus rosea]|uniref:Class I SAM-dependent methyltransferase n=1 Tax=Sediminicoccus rosea TaxID=1225128 RepID=A0ABZ0PKU3_9PROT|nr:class I SAM-dependent methyltransferase [Sediminicoccus rosea]WPB86066.1 class I SAM-dependent methyltransferase [Sediminicoccus rosea]